MYTLGWVGGVEIHSPGGESRRVGWGVMKPLCRDKCRDWVSAENCGTLVGLVGGGGDYTNRV
jgi:hypothetical protein